MTDINEENLQGGQFFHGAYKKVEDTHIRPAKVHGKGSTWGSANSARGEAAHDFAWAHPDEKVAWNFAAQRSSIGATERPVVHTVTPDNNLTTPGQDSSAKGEVKNPEGFKITGQSDIAPGRQGTFPDINWHQFADQRKLSTWEANHPSDHAIKYGHETLHRAGIEDAPGSQENNYRADTADLRIQEHLRLKQAQRDFPNQSDPSTVTWMAHQKAHHDSGAALSDPKLFKQTRASKKVTQDPHGSRGDMPADYQQRVRRKNERAAEWEIPGESKAADLKPYRKMAR
jgi:hypothetical protein